MNVSGMALQQYFNDTCRITEVSVDLERRMCIEKIRIGSSSLSFLDFGGDQIELVSDKFECMIPIQTSCPETNLPSHRPTGRRITTLD